MMIQYPDATQIAEVVSGQEVSAKSIVGAALTRIAATNQQLNCFTTVLGDRALEAAAALDQSISQGKKPGPLCGVPFAVKNLFDIAGITTIAGSKIHRQQPPAAHSATAITRLEKAGAILLGALNMDEYAYGFVTENEHYGPTHNPHDLSRIAGGSSGGSAAAVAGGLVPLSLGSDTNGSIRVPASLCGVYGFKPTYGRLSRSGAMLFSSSLDHIGPFTRSARDLALIFDSLQGEDPQDPVCTSHPPNPCLPQLHLGIEGLKIAIAGGYFQQGATPEALEAVERIAKALNVTETIELPEVHRARAAAYLITAVEGATLHWQNLRSRPQDFDSATRDRFLSGAFIPSPWYHQSQRFRRWFRDQMQQVFQGVDLLLTPTTPCSAPEIGQTTFTLNGEEVLIRPNLGLYTQPFSFIGLPALSLPLTLSGKLPLGVQIVAAPYQEAKILRVAAVLESQGLISNLVPKLI